MMLDKCLYYLLLCLCVFIVDVRCRENILVDVIRAEFLKLEDKLWNFTLQQENKEDGPDPASYIIKQFEEFHERKILQLPKDLLYGLDVARQTFPFLTFYADLRVIDDMYEKFRRYRKKYLTLNGGQDGAGYEREIMTTNIIDDILQDEKNSVNETIRRIYEHVSPHHRKMVLGEVIEITDDDYICKGNSQSPQQVFYNLYNSIAINDLKGYMMEQFALLVLTLEEPGNYTDVSVEKNKLYRERVKELVLTFREHIQGQHRKLWKCDPKHHIPDGTYVEVTRLLQAHIQNEVDLNQGGTCRRTCNDYPNTRSYGCYDRESDYCRLRKPCNGRLLECKSMKEDVRACISPPHSTRRYEYLEFYHGDVLGKRKTCNSRRAASWRRWFVKCTYCLCICDEEGRFSDRHFNLRPVMADVANNRVVTGVRFVKHNRIIHLQIQQGELLPHGYINASTVRWVPVDDYKITDSNVKEGIDYFTMKFERRAMNMDDLASHESDHIITGVNFVTSNFALMLQINVRRFNFTDGRLSEDNHFILGSKSDRSEIKVVSPDIPTTTSKTMPNFDTDKYVVFTHTDLYKDAAQTTIPFIDIQPVYSNPAVPLKGLGIYYKGKEGYGGFIAPIITTYDFGKYISDYLPESFTRINRKENEVIIN